MDCSSLRGLSKIPPEQLQAYIRCMEAPSAGTPEQAISSAQGVFVSAIIIALSVSQLVGTSNTAWRGLMLAVMAAGLAGLAYSAFNL